MDSAEHQHGASAAPPPKAAPLPSESCNATKTNEPLAVAASTPPASATTASKTTAAASTNTNTASTTIGVARSNFSISSSRASANPNKRPLVLVSKMSPASGLSVPALKKNETIGYHKNSIHTNKAAKKVTVTKATKKTLKKKKKKFSSILSGMMKPKKMAIDIQVERESLRKNLGGGNFAKIAKI